jgi:hypothetical protein
MKVGETSPGKLVLGGFYDLEDNFTLTPFNGTLDLSDMTVSNEVYNNF